MQEQRVDHAHTAEAAVNAPAPDVTLYDEAGRPLTVPAADEAVWAARGFRRQPRDARASLKDLPALWKAAHEALKAAVDETHASGELDTSADAAYHTAREALKGLEQGLVAVLDGLHAAPVKQQEG